MKSITTIRLSTLSLALVLGMSISASAQAESDDFELYDPVWRVNPADVEFLYDINDKGEPLYINQGGTVNRKTGNILIPTMIDGDPQIAIVDPSEGSLIGYMNMTEEVRGSDHRLHIIEVAATRDGQIFASNQVLSANLRIYYWADETADPIVVFNQAVEKPGGGDFSQWGKGLAVLGIGNDLTVLVSGFQNPNILVLNWNEGELEIENTFQTTPFSYGNGFAEIPGSGDVVWTNGIGVEASLFNYKTGELSASVDAGILSTDYNDIDYIETNLGKFLIAGPDFPKKLFLS